MSVNNNCSFIGRLVADPENKSSQKNGGEALAIAKFRLAVDRRDKEKNTDFIPFTAFGKTAECILSHCKKGSKLAIQSKCQTGSYDGKDGKKVYTTDFIVEEFEFCEKKSDSTSSGTAQAQAQPQGVPAFQQPPAGLAPQGQPPMGYAPQGQQPPMGYAPQGQQPPMGYGQPGAFQPTFAPQGQPGVQNLSGNSYGFIN